MMTGVSIDEDPAMDAIIAVLKSITVKDPTEGRRERIDRRMEINTMYENGIREGFEWQSSIEAEVLHETDGPRRLQALHLSAETCTQFLDRVRNRSWSPLRSPSPNRDNRDSEYRTRRFSMSFN